jgi:hypothetical protein
MRISCQERSSWASQLLPPVVYHLPARLSCVAAVHARPQCSTSMARACMCLSTAQAVQHRQTMIPPVLACVRYVPSACAPGSCSGSTCRFVTQVALSVGDQPPMQFIVHRSATHHDVAAISARVCVSELCRCCVPVLMLCVLCNGFDQMALIIWWHHLEACRQASSAVAQQFFFTRFTTAHFGMMR